MMVWGQTPTCIHLFTCLRKLKCRLFTNVLICVMSYKEGCLGRAKCCDSCWSPDGASVVTQDVLYRTFAHDSCPSRTVHYAPLHPTRVFGGTEPTCHLASVTS
jgi:hypothetical protein